MSLAESKTFVELMKYRNNLSEDIQTLSAKKKEADEQLGLLMAEAGERAVTADGLRAILYDSRGPSRIDRLLLLGAGVSADVIAKCTVDGKPYTAIKIEKVKEGG